MRPYLIAAIPLVLSAGLLLALRLNIPHQYSAALIERRDAAGSALDFSPETVARGMDFKTGGNEWKEYSITIGSAVTTIALAENTDVTLVDASSPTPKFALRGGRVVINGPADVSARNVNVEMTYLANFVFYSWLDQLDFSVLGGTAKETDSQHPGNAVTGTAGASFTVNTLSGDLKEAPPFTPRESSAKSFYDWSLPN
jgi:hypothetical protein